MSIIFSKRADTILASAARTATGQSNAFSVGNQDFLSVLVDVTAASGTGPSLTVNVEWSHDGTNWFTADPADAFTALTAAGKRTKVFQVKGLVARLNYTIAGTTPSFTFSATALTGN